MASAPTPLALDDLFDAMLVGYAALQADRPNTLARKSAGIFRSLTLAAVMPEAQRRQLTRDYRFLSHMMTRAEIVYGDGDGTKRPPRRRLLELVSNSAKELLILIVPREPMQYAKLVGADGYLLVITEAGIERAHASMPHFPQLSELGVFMTAWRSYVHQIQSMHAKNSASAARSTSQIATSDDELLPTIGQATRRAADFEW